MVLLTDAERPIEIEDWEATADKMNSLNINFTIMYVKLFLFLCFDSSTYSIILSGVDFDDDELPFHEEDKSNIKVRFPSLSSSLPSSSPSHHQLHSA